MRAAEGSPARRRPPRSASTRAGSSPAGSSPATSSSPRRTGRAGSTASRWASPPTSTPASPTWASRAIGRVVAALNAEQPDIHLLLGDYLDASQILGRHVAPEAVAAELARLRAPLGTVAVIGNHDWRASGDRMWRALDRAGITVLEDAPWSATASGSPASATCATATRTSRGRCRRSRRARPPSCSATTPTCSRRSRAASRSPWPATPTAARWRSRCCAARILPSRYGERYARGHIVEGGRHLYVSHGVGTSGLPLRLFAPPEVLRFTLRAAATP